MLGAEILNKPPQEQARAEPIGFFKLVHLTLVDVGMSLRVYEATQSTSAQHGTRLVSYQ